MRLVDVHTFQLREFFEDDIPRYAILSHRWGHEEVSFDQLTTSLTGAKELAGFVKIRYCADQARSDGLDWCWVDTCCIDKRSSSELSEAINSMYRWYENSVKCYAYLQDIATSGPDTNILKSQWFTRGWTLQELIAPKDVTFYSVNWSNIGGKTQFASEISKHCGISKNVLGGGPLGDKSIAQRMRWAAGRKTSRVEDIAYSLLGIFDVNMPLLYGEGKKAFVRLQKEIIKTSFDHTIFCWQDQNASRNSFRSLLARSPAEFNTGRRIYFVPGQTGVPFLFTNRGLQISLPLQPVKDNPMEYLAFLHCYQGAHLNDPKRVGISVRLRRVGSDSNQFMRVDPDRLYKSEANQPLNRVYVPEKMPSYIRIGERAVIDLSFDTENCTAVCHAVWDDERVETGQNEAKQLRLKLGSSKKLVIRILLRSCKDPSRSMLHQLIYNFSHVTPLLMPPEVQECDPFGSTCPPRSFHRLVGLPTEWYDVKDTPTTDTVQWNTQYAQSSSCWISTWLGDDYFTHKESFGAPDFQRPAEHNGPIRLGGL
ncbi:hypothetical protein HBI56_041350 [Parastagonospora nodorum]|uniref:Heterokaryon incompatibility domain-containing protein n=1 Tax=Phaeosphaeria nodorum (strain SN15 / ATCC MYA-4574 / FGSC 10173) TaxID=321614 RepID=A0A7U2EV35_PHANO|nr:hypothetical protein HBH56_065410 [Parastagonospora nodorum]QRC93262.1 hypothetical protein JI435_302660 [Parastagonospora nodorum SN15]KAH3932297.1 hypothetical protein HBH54_082680 [Parastagonospora nodorum]KAH3954752.1 hypothetical protein HBH53_011710 [Parastagonospora nodorum]KAH3986631.1 hypothetical protein HBH52_042910 [Parastagonospora nodorum]